MWSKRFWIKETNPVNLMKFYTKLLKDSGFTIKQCVIQKFNPQGFTAVWVLAESHLALHTFPEESKAYVELSSCNKQMFKNFMKGVKNVSENFKPALRFNCLRGLWKV